MYEFLSFRKRDDKNLLFQKILKEGKKWTQYVLLMAVLWDDFVGDKSKQNGLTSAQTSKILPLIIFYVHSIKMVTRPKIFLTLSVILITTTIIFFWECKQIKMTRQICCWKLFVAVLRLLGVVETSYKESCWKQQGLRDFVLM